MDIPDAIIQSNGGKNVEQRRNNERKLKWEKHGSHAANDIHERSKPLENANIKMQNQLRLIGD